MRLTELARRGGATPLTECSEFSEALRSSVGVADRERSRPLADDEAPFRGLRGAPPPRLLATLGERLIEGRKEEPVEVEGRGESRGEDRETAGDERESSLRERDRSAARLFVDSRRRGELEKEAIVFLLDSLPRSNQAPAIFFLFSFFSFFSFV